MVLFQRRAIPLLSVLMTLIAGCSSDAVPIRATWEYTELSRSDTGAVQEVGKKHVLQSGGDESYQVDGNSLDVVAVAEGQAKFRFTGSDFTEKQEVELQPGHSQDIWSGAKGVRLRVEKIGPIQ